MCGYENPLSLRLCFKADERGIVHTVFKGNEGLQGYRGILHGGVISSLLDAAMTNCLFNQGIEALTGDLRVRFLKPVPCTVSLDIRAWVETSLPPLYQLRAELVYGETVMARAEATFARFN
jgi:acyl-coenzyme A thioesterase PaaI-like protein